MPIFAIGLGRTATTSLHRAFQLLGYHSFHLLEEDEIVRDPTERLLLIGQAKQEKRTAIDLVERAKSEGKELLFYLKQYEAFSDHPFDWNYKILYKQYPGSKFILTTRPMDTWLASRAAHVARIAAVGRSIADQPTEAQDRIKYVEHHAAVADFFKNKELLTMDITQGDGWEKLCPFLGKEIPNTPFPRENES